MGASGWGICPSLLTQGGVSLSGGIEMRLTGGRVMRPECDCHSMCWGGGWRYSKDSGSSEHPSERGGSCVVNSRIGCLLPWSIEG